VAAGAAPEHVFVLFLAATALLLVAGTEVVFIVDLFGNRMNTVFKLYYQAWVLLALVGAYGVWYLATCWASQARGASTRAVATAALVLGFAGIAAGLVYAPAALESRTDASAGPATLDGAAYLAHSLPDDYAAILWLQNNVAGNPVIVEAPGGSYTQYGRVSGFSGLPTILGWDFHEAQWRGSYEQQSQRQADVEQIYRSADRDLVLRLLGRYGATYVYVGPLEVEKYGRGDRTSLDLFPGFMDTAYRAGGVVIYRVRGQP
jgi:YYY domain-containing protein